MIATPLVPELLTDGWARSAAHVHRRSFQAAMPWLAPLHTPEEDLQFYQTHVFRTCSVWGIVEQDELTGLIAFRENWVDHLYVLPEFQGHGVGAKLLDIAKTRNAELQLWTFERNRAARSFYEKRGFDAIEFTDGAGNEEKEPDVLYRWRREV